MKPPLIQGVLFTDAKRAVLEALSRCPNGSTAVPGLLPGAALAALVQMGLARRLPADALGGNRYAITEAGRALLPPPEEEAI